MPIKIDSSFSAIDEHTLAEFHRKFSINNIFYTLFLKKYLGHLATIKKLEKSFSCVCNTYANIL